MRWLKTALALSVLINAFVAAAYYQQREAKVHAQLELQQFKAKVQYAAAVADRALAQCSTTPPVVLALPDYQAQQTQQAAERFYQEATYEIQRQRIRGR